MKLHTELGNWDLFCAADIKCVGEVSREFMLLRCVGRIMEAI